MILLIEKKIVNDSKIFKKFPFASGFFLNKTFLNKLTYFSFFFKPISGMHEVI